MIKRGWTDLENKGLDWDIVISIIETLKGKAGGLGVGLVNACKRSGLSINDFASKPDEDIIRDVKGVGQEKINLFDRSIVLYLTIKTKIESASDALGY